MKEPSRDAALGAARVDFACVDLQNREAKLFENPRGRRIVTQSRGSDFEGAQGINGKFDQEGGELGTEAPTPERGEDRVSDRGDAG